jgi:acyl-CoA thioesterase FadM
VGNSSIHFYQQIFQNDICVAKAETVSVQVLNETGKSRGLSEDARLTLQNWLLS